MNQTQFINLPGFLRILQFFIITNKKQNKNKQKLDVEKIRNTYDTRSILILPPRTQTQYGILLYTVNSINTMIHTLYNIGTHTL